MKKNNIIIISLLIVLTVGIVGFNYTNQLVALFVEGAAPNPGHSLSEIEGGADLATKTYVATAVSGLATETYVNNAVSGISESNWTPSGTNIYNSNSGNVGIGITVPTEKLHVNGNVVATSYYYTSDIRLKDNINSLEDSLSKILKLEGISYTLQSTKEDKLGFSAQELQKVFPELVKENNEGYLSIDGSGLIAPLVEAVKEQQTIIESQQTEIDELKDIINNLK